MPVHSNCPMTFLGVHIVSLLFLAALVAGCQTDKQATPEHVSHASGLAVPALHGVVATDAPLATHAGVEVLRQGGNAVDATVATAFALAVVHPSAGNIGGGGFIVARLADSSTVALDFRERAPGRAARDMYLDPRGDVTTQSVTGPLAAGIPGTVAGLWEFHRRYGILPWSALLSPAIRLAEQGFILDSTFAKSVADEASRLAQFPASASLFLPDGRPLRAGSLWKNPDLGKTLRRIAGEGPAGFYSGETAELIVAEMEHSHGIITRDDLRRYHPVWRDPTRSTYRGHTLLSMPPPSSGGTTLAMIAAIVERYDLPSMRWHSPLTLHVMVEAMRRSFADRNYYLGDPDVVPIPLSTLLSRAYADRRRSDIDTLQATPSRLVSHGRSDTVREPIHTTHFSIADEHGNAVAMTTTLNLGYGSAVTVGGAGFLLNNEMDDFAAKPGTPNAFGLIQGEANAIAPGKSMLSSMTPTIVLDAEGRVMLITGASGGPRIITAVFQIISNVIDFRQDIATAVRAPRIHHQHLPDIVYYERDGLTPDEQRALEKRGHVLKEVEHLAVGASILRGGEGWLGMADPRTRGLALGY